MSDTPRTDECPMCGPEAQTIRSTSCQKCGLVFASGPDTTHNALVAVKRDLAAANARADSARRDALEEAAMICDGCYGLKSEAAFHIRALINAAPPVAAQPQSGPPSQAQHPGLESAATNTDTQKI